MMNETYAHKLTFHLSLSVEGACDSRAPGGAVTVALCGHWDHEGECRWPHLSTITEGDDGCHELIVQFDASLEEVEVVEEKVREALEQGRLIGPDGRETTWSLKKGCRMKSSRTTRVSESRL